MPDSIHGQGQTLWHDRETQSSAEVSVHGLHGFTYKPLLSTTDTTDTTCSICLDAREGWDIKVRHVPCGRHFCHECVKDWAKHCLSGDETPYCPLCHDPIATGPISEILFVQLDVSPLKGRLLGDDERSFRIERDLSQDEANNNVYPSSLYRLYVQPKLLNIMNETALKQLLRWVISDDYMESFTSNSQSMKVWDPAKDKGMEELGMHPYLGASYLHVVNYDEDGVLHSPNEWVVRALAAKNGSQLRVSGRGDVVIGGFIMLRGPPGADTGRIDYRNDDESDWDDIDAEDSDLDDFEADEDDFGPPEELHASQLKRDCWKIAILWISFSLPAGFVIFSWLARLMREWDILEFLFREVDMPPGFLNLY